MASERLDAALLIAVAIAAAAPAMAQQARTFEVPRPARVEVTAKAFALPDFEEQRQRFLERLERLRTHHKPIPIDPAMRAFSTARSAKELQMRPREAGLGAGADVTARLPVNAAAGIRLVSPVAEPTVGVRGAEVLATFNWWAAMSLDGGKSFTPIDVQALWGTQERGKRFCCDQVAVYDKAVDAMYWLMQGEYDSDGNRLKLLFAKGADIKQQKWLQVELASKSLLDKTGYWLDYPDLSFSAKHIFISSNVYTTRTEAFAGAIVLRLDKERLLAGTASEGRVQDLARGTARFTQGAGTTMYFVAHRAFDTVALWRWADVDDSPAKPIDVTVETWQELSDKTTAGSEAPNGKPWLSRGDGRMGTAWLADGVIGFAWNAGADNLYPLPHVRVARVKEAEVAKAVSPLKPVSEPHLWSGSFALAYAAAAPNDSGDVGLIVSYGGKGNYPGYAVGVLPDDDSAVSLSSVRVGRNTPKCPKDCGVWGDYFSVRRLDGSGWAGAGYTIQGDDKDPFSVEIDYVTFKKRP